MHLPASFMIGYYFYSVIFLRSRYQSISNLHTLLDGMSNQFGKQFLVPSTVPS